MEQQLPARLSEGEIAQFIEYNDVDSCEALCEVAGVALSLSTPTHPQTWHQGQ